MHLLIFFCFAEKIRSENAKKRGIKLDCLWLGCSSASSQHIDKRRLLCYYYPISMSFTYRWDPIPPSDTPALGFFLRCRGKETEKPRKRANKQWSCVASADLIIKSCKAGVDGFTRKIEHEFKPSPDDDWGFTQFMELRVRDRPICVKT